MQLVMMSKKGMLLYAPARATCLGLKDAKLLNLCVQVSSKDTLAGIAIKYNVSVSSTVAQPHRRHATRRRVSPAHRFVEPH